MQDLGGKPPAVLMMATETRGLGGQWALPTIPPMPDERIAKIGEALARQPGRVSGAFGRLCLTNQRLIWNPSSLYRWLRIEEPFISLLAELDCKVGKPSIWYGFPIVLETKERSFWLYIHSPEILWARALRRTAREWANAIEAARQTAKG